MTIPKVPMQLLVEEKEHRADLHISGDITRGIVFWGMKLKNDTDVEYNDVAEALADLPDDVTEIVVHINSYGGEVAEGVAIYNALRAHPAKVTTVCEGFACSIASVVFMAGTERVMRPSSLLMLHNASMYAGGDANAHRKAADDLDVITELSRTAYLSHATDELTPELLQEVMDAETWVTPETALSWGLATSVDEPDDDADEPTQHAGALVFDALTGSQPLQLVSEGFDFERFREEVFTRLEDLEGIMTKQQVTDTKVHIADPKSSQEQQETMRERCARIFRNLSQE